MADSNRNKFVIDSAETYIDDRLSSLRISFPDDYEERPAYKAMMCARAYLKEQMQPVNKTITLPTAYSGKVGRHMCVDSEVQAIMLPDDNGAWLNKLDVICALENQGFKVVRK